MTQEHKLNTSNGQDILFKIYYEDGYETKYLTDMQVQATDQIQTIRSRIVALLPQRILSPTSQSKRRRVNLQISQYVIVRIDVNHPVLCMAPEDHYVLLKSDEPYTVEQILENMPEENDYEISEHLKQFFRVIKLNHVQVVAVIA